MVEQSDLVARATFYDFIPLGTAQIANLQGLV
jgi:hypothetical protein